MPDPRPRRSPAPGAAAPLAQTWLTAKRAMEPSEQATKGHSDRARRADLARWGQLLATLDADAEARLDVASALAHLSLSDLSTDLLVDAVSTAKRCWSEATVARMLSTLRGFTRRGLLARDPCDSELLRVYHHTQRRPRAVDADAVEAMVTAALAAPTDRQRMFWPDRDVALLRFLAGSGARAEEVCGATIAEIDRPPNGRSGGSGAPRAANNATSPCRVPPSRPLTPGWRPAGHTAAAESCPSPACCSCAPTPPP